LACSCSTQVYPTFVPPQLISLNRQPRPRLIDRILRIAQELRRRDHPRGLVIPQRALVVVQHRIGHCQTTLVHLHRRVAAVADDRVAEAAGAGGAAHGQAAPVARGGRAGRSIVVRVPAVGVVLERGQDDGCGFDALNNQGAVHGPARGRQELDDRPRSGGQAGAAGDGHAAGHVDQIRVPGRGARDRARHLDAVGRVVGGDVAAEARLGVGLHLDRVRALVAEIVVPNDRCGGGLDVDAAPAVARKGVALHGRVGLVLQEKAVAGVVRDLTVGDPRCRAVDVERVVDRVARVAHHDVVQHVHRVVAAVRVGDAAPVAGDGPVGVVGGDERRRTNDEGSGNRHPSLRCPSAASGGILSGTPRGLRGGVEGRRSALLRWPLRRLPRLRCGSAQHACSAWGLQFAICHLQVEHIVPELLVADRREDDSRRGRAIRHQRAVDRDAGAGVVELDDRAGLDREGRAGVDRQRALDHVVQVRVPGLVEAHRARDPHRVAPVVVGHVVGQRRVAGGVHVDRVAAVAPELVVGQVGGRGGLQLDAAPAVVQDPVAADRGRGVVAQQQAVAAVVADLVVAEDDRRGRVHKHAEAAAPRIAHGGELELGLAVHAAVREGEAAPVAGFGGAGRAIAVGVAAQVVLERGEDDPLPRVAERAEHPVDRQLFARSELDDHAGLDRQLDARVDRDVGRDDVGAAGRIPGGVGRDVAAHGGPGRRRAGRWERVGQRHGRDGPEAGEVHVVAHRVADPAGVRRVGRAGVAAPPVLGRHERVRTVGVLHAVERVAVDRAVLDDRVGGRGVVEAHLVAGQSQAAEVGAGIVGVDPAVLGGHDRQVLGRAGRAALEDKAAGAAVAAAVAKMDVRKLRPAAGLGEGQRFPVAGRGVGGIGVAVRVAAGRVILQRGKEDRLARRALGQQAAVDRPLDPRGELDHDAGLERQDRVDLQRGVARDHVGQVRLPGRVAADAARQPDAVDRVAAGRVAAEDRLRRPAQVDCVAGVAQEAVLAHRGAGGRAEPQAVIRVVLERAAPQGWRRRVEQLQAIAAAQLDGQVIERGRRAVERDAGRGRAGAIVVPRARVADEHVVEDRRRIV